jgi:hypothetical protein
MEADVEASGTADAGNPDESHADTLFDDGDMFTNGHDGRVVFSNGVSSKPMAQRHSMLHVWDVT